MYKDLLGEDLNVKVKEALKDKGKTLLINDLKESNYVPKSRLDEVISERNQLKTQLSESTEQLETLKKSAKGNDKLLEQIENFQKEKTDWIKMHEVKVIEDAIKYKALEEKAKNPSLLSKLLDPTKLQVDKEGKIIGLDEQIKILKEKESYLFNGADEKPPVPQSGGVNPGGLPKPATLHQQYEDLCKEIQKNPTNRDLITQRFQLKEQLAKQT